MEQPIDMGHDDCEVCNEARAANSKEGVKKRVLDIIKTIHLSYNREGIPYAHWQEIVRIESEISAL